MSNYPDNNPKTAAGAAKVPLHLVPPSSIHYLALALADGAKKYGPYNWRDTPISASVYRAARLRHEALYWDGEDVASDSRVNHLAHIMACCAIELDALSVGMLNDDRPTSGASARLQADYSIIPQVESGGINPAVEVIPHEVAKRMQRDVIVPIADDATKDDDEGSRYEVPPSCSTGGCGDE